MEVTASPVEAVILGSGTSHGVPMIGCRCAVCTSDDPHDRRTRTSVYVRLGDLRILVDTSPEMRLQCIREGIDAVDAVLLTHHHADHIAGLDDLRRFNWLMKAPVQVYGTERTLENVRRMFLYAFEVAPDSPHSRPQIELCRISEEAVRIKSETIVPIPLLHGSLPVLGYRFGNFAYCTDCNHIPESSLALLKDLDVLVLDALRKAPHPAHFNIEQAAAMARRIGAKQTFFTHITHQLSHRQTNAELPPTMALAHDGLRISL